MNAIQYIYTMEYYAATRKNEIMKFIYKWRDIQSIRESEMSQKERDMDRIITLFCCIQTVV